MFARIRQVKNLYSLYTVFPFLIFLIFFLVGSAEFGKNGELNFSRPLEFKFREYVGNAPLIHDRVKVLVFDDTSLHRLGSPDLSIIDWQILLQAIGSQNPKAIIIDKIFAVAPSGTPELTSSETRQKNPVYVGGNASDSAITLRDSLDLLHGDYRPQLFFASPDQWQEWPGSVRKFAYGPAASLLLLFEKVGHINYDLFGRIRPFFKIEGGHVFPHLSILAADTISVRSNKLYLNEANASVNDNGQLQVNFPPLPAMSRRLFSLSPFVLAAKNNNASIFKENIKNDDIVLILPLFFTGNTDFKETPIGTIPAGLIHLAVINSVLQKQWLQDVPGQTAAILFFAIFGSVFGFYLSPLRYFFLSTLFGAVTVLSSLILFSYLNLIIPWLYPLLAFTSSGAVTFIYRSWQKDRLAASLQSSFQGLVSKKTLSEFIANPDKMIRETKELTITIMFIDIVGFSAFSSKESPKIVFDRLKKFIDQCSGVIHEHQGIIDKTLGDGLLAFFGHDYTGQKLPGNHAENAVLAALKIQRNTMAGFLLAKDHHSILPLRIGINTATVYIGNLGSPPRIDFTIIGDGVNFAQRLESACAPFHVNVSQSTLDFSDSFFEDSEGVVSRTISVKHFDESFEVYEIDPFYNESEKLLRAEKAYEASKNKIRRFIRWPVADPERICVETSIGLGIIVDYSRTGFSLFTESKLATDQLVNIILTGDADFEETLKVAGVKNFLGEVKWSRPSEGRFLSGFYLANLTSDQRDSLFKAMRKVFSIKRESK